MAFVDAKPSLWVCGPPRFHTAIVYSPRRRPFPEARIFSSYSH